MLYNKQNSNDDIHIGWESYLALFERKKRLLNLSIVLIREDNVDNAIYQRRF